MIKIKNEEKRVFLEKLNEGDLVLYYFKDKQGKRFFLEQKGDSGQIVEIPRKGVEKHHFRGILKPYVQDCNNISEALKLVTYHKPSLTKFANHYNSCSSKPFPFIRYGLTLGYGFVQPSGFKISKPVIKDAVFKNDYTLNVGIFADLPIFNSYFSFHPEMYIQKNAFTSHSVIVNNVNDIVINATSLNVPLLIRYTFPTSKLRPYINAGSTLSYNVRNDNEAYTVTTNNNIVEIESISSDTFYSEKQMGATVGAGIQYNIDYKRSLFFELRNTRLYGFTKETYGNKSLQCLIGINF